MRQSWLRRLMLPAPIGGRLEFLGRQKPAGETGILIKRPGQDLGIIRGFRIPVFAIATGLIAFAALNWHEKVSVCESSL